jgi:hypothetical protein
MCLEVASFSTELTRPVATVAVLAALDAQLTDCALHKAIGLQVARKAVAALGTYGRSQLMNARGAHGVTSI